MALDLILSSSEIFPHTGSFAPDTNFTTSYSGSAALNSSLATDKLTNAGTYCREWKALGGDTSAFVLNVISSSGDSVYSGPFGTSRAYSLRASIKTDFLTSNTIRSGIGLAIRTLSGSQVPNTGTDQPGKNHPVGYNVLLSGLKNDNTAYETSAFAENRIGLSLSAVQTNGVADFVVECSGAADNYYNGQEWHRVRIDVIPVGSAADVLNVYTASVADVAIGNETWEQVATKTVNSTDAGYLSPTGSDVAIGWYCFHRNNGATNQTGSVFIDNLVILAKDL